MKPHKERGDWGASCQPCLDSSWEKMSFLLVRRPRKFYQQLIKTTFMHAHVENAHGKTLWSLGMETSMGTFPLVLGHTEPLCKFFHSQHPKPPKKQNKQQTKKPQPTKLCAPGAALSNLHMQVQGKSQHLWSRGFSDANGLALDWFYQLWGSMHSTPHPEARMAQKAVNQLVLSCKCVVLAQTVA